MKRSTQPKNGRVERQTEQERKAADAAFEFVCPKCGAAAEFSVDLGLGKPRQYCSQCGESWGRGSGSHCLRCEKPLGGTDALCYTCQTELGMEQ